MVNNSQTDASLTFVDEGLVDIMVSCYRVISKSHTKVDGKVEKKLNLTNICKDKKTSSVIYSGCTKKM